MVSAVRFECVPISGWKAMLLISFGIPIVCSILVYLLFVSFMYFTGERMGVSLNDLPLVMLVPIFGLYFKGWIFMLSVASLFGLLLARGTQRK
jgi:hypothetical protein